MMARIAAAIVALTALTGLIIQFRVTHGQTGSVSATLWILVRFFTILTNMVVALTLMALAAGQRVTPRWTGGIILAILLVGIVAATLLRGLLHLDGTALLADTLLHKATPLLTLCWWLGFAHKGRLRRSDPWIWTLFPALYLPYALLRGVMEGIYAYPFINVAKLGIGQVLANALMIAIAFVIAGHALVWIDRQLSARPSRLRPTR
ncbi:Pr6Pr family membrane protein [Sphingobium sp.]|uniref:Pr6Pr family membrane protein n=1 Tax=Sphingobium sp. TaxID=1912891 RepID=UPI00261ECE3F|nr:Pr6Pr family membrane protein [Sphingobium sp.]